MKLSDKRISIPDGFGIGRTCLMGNNIIAEVVANGYIREFSKVFPNHIVIVITQSIADHKIFIIIVYGVLMSIKSLICANEC